jgi:hypothetical protein
MLFVLPAIVEPLALIPVNLFLSPHKHVIVVHVNEQRLEKKN